MRTKQIIIAVYTILALFTSCKDEGKNSGEDTTTAVTNVDERTITGEFIYIDNVAVLQQNNTVYAVKLDEIAKSLAERVVKIQTDPYDVVMVTVKGTIEPKPAGTEGWDQILTIREVIEINDTPVSPDLEIVEKKN